MKKVDFNKLQAGDLVEVPRTQFAPMRSGWNGWLFSEAVVIRKGVGRKSKKNVVVVEMRTPAGKNSYGTIEATFYAENVFTTPAAKNARNILKKYGIEDAESFYKLHIRKERAGSMTKKKPDFLRDLDTAIMDELTGGGIKGNAAGLVGTLTQIKEIKQLCGLPFCGYMAKLETARPSGVPDEVTVVFAEDIPYRACNGIEFDVMQEFVEGSRLLLTGKVQTLKDFQSGRLLVYILADFVAVSEKAVEQDETAVRGVIANKPTYRETPRGKRITDITVKVRNELTGGSCFLPCICWQEQADEAAQWQQGDTVELLGRYQSRQYEKVLDTATGEREQRTAYEVSVRLIRRKEEAENEC